MSSRRVYELLDGVQEGVHAFLETSPDTKPTTVDVRIAITEDEVTVEEIDKAQRTTSYGLLKQRLQKRLEMYKSELDAIRRNPDRPLPEIREKEGMQCAFEAVVTYSIKEVQLEAKAEVLALVLAEMDELGVKL